MEAVKTSKTPSIPVIGEREKTVIAIVSHMDDKELFGLQCYLAGRRVGAAVSRTSDGETAEAV